MAENNVVLALGSCPGSNLPFTGGDGRFQRKPPVNLRILSSKINTLETYDCDWNYKGDKSTKNNKPHPLPIVLLHFTSPACYLTNKILGHVIT